MNKVILVSFLAVATLCLCHAADLGHSNSANDSPSSEAFISRRESAAVIKRQKRNFARVAAAAAAPTGKPYEGLWEVCELNAACDDLASLVGIQEAYRRFYGPV